MLFYRAVYGMPVTKVTNLLPSTIMSRCRAAPRFGVVCRSHVRRHGSARRRTNKNWCRRIATALPDAASRAHTHTHTHSSRMLPFPALISQRRWVHASTDP